MYSQDTFYPGECPNCHKRKGFMGSSEWNHDAYVCSRACGDRLHQRIENGMVLRQDYCGDRYVGEAMFNERVKDLRVRIKQLEHQAKAASKETRRCRNEAAVLRRSCDYFGRHRRSCAISLLEHAAEVLRDMVDPMADDTAEFIEKFVSGKGE